MNYFFFMIYFKNKILNRYVSIYKKNVSEIRFKNEKKELVQTYTLIY